MFRVVPAVLVSIRNDEIPIARISALTKAGRDLGFDTIHDLGVKRRIVVRKIGLGLDEAGQSKKDDQGSEKHIARAYRKRL
jgi:hypothetical protein